MFSMKDFPFEDSSCHPNHKGSCFAEGRNESAKMRAARAARLFFLIQPIMFLVYGIDIAATLLKPLLII